MDAAHPGMAASRRRVAAVQICRLVVLSKEMLIKGILPVISPSIACAEMLNKSALP